MMNFSHERPIVRLNNFILDLSKSSIKGQVRTLVALQKQIGPTMELPGLYQKSLFSNVLWKLGSSARYLKVLRQVYNLSPSLNRH
ncbi:hypothetical protein Peur_009231 [Populus x canadensis]